jgi:hypothetical protein
MNEPWLESAEQLRLATARALPPEAALDAETASARETFLSLGSALETAGGAIDEAALVARLLASCKRDEAAALCRVERLARRVGWLVLAGGALAASILAIAVNMRGLVPEENQVVVQQPPTSVGAPAADRVSDSLASAEDEPFEPAAAPSEGWTDPLDDAIAAASATLGELATSQRGVDRSLVDMNDRLEALVLELESESL